MIVEYVKNLVLYIISINANAFWTIIDFLSQNWFMLISLIFISILIFTEIKVRSIYIVDDRRSIY